jgi:hypothetical protein
VFATILDGPRLVPPLGRRVLTLRSLDRPLHMNIIAAFDMQMSAARHHSSRGESRSTQVRIRRLLYHDFTTPPPICGARNSRGTRENLTGKADADEGRKDSVIAWS